MMKPNQNSRSRVDSRAIRGQIGWGLLEVGVVLVLIAIVISTLSGYAAQSQEQMKLNNDGQQLQVVADAAKALIASPPPNISYPHVFTVNDLYAGYGSQGYLSKAVNNTIGDQQTFQLLVKQDAHSTRLQGLLMTTGGVPYSDSQAGQVAQVAGTGAGFIRSNQHRMIKGVDGAWSSLVSAWAMTDQTGQPVELKPGQVMVLIGAGYGKSGGDLDGPWLARLPHMNDPSYNQMTEDITMNNSNIVDAAEIDANLIQGSDKSLALPNIRWDAYGTLVFTASEFHFFPTDDHSAADVSSSIQPLVKISALPDPYTGSSTNIYLGGYEGWLKVAGIWDIKWQKEPARMELGKPLPQPALDLFVSNQLFCLYSYTYCEALPSDRRLKTDLTLLPNALENINKLHGYRFKWKANGRRDIGVIAQEVEKVYPLAVYTRQKTGLKYVSYGSLVAPLIEAVKSLTAKNQTLADELKRQQAEYDEQRLDLIKFKHAIGQALSVEEKSVCQAACPNS